MVRDKYYAQMYKSKPEKHKTKWTPVTKEEIEAFLGILILMGIVALPCLKMYWSQDVLIGQQHIKSIIPRTQFLQILQYFHLADSAAAPREEGYDKLYRVREFLNIVSVNIEREYNLSRDISIDETMVPHKERLAYKQYIKSKPTKWGIKVRVLSEARSGYIYKFQVYLGK